MWVTKLLISPVKKRIFCPKMTKFGPKLAFLVNLGLAMQAYSVPCCWVSWWLWRAGCISQDTYLLYFFNYDLFFSWVVKFRLALYLLCFFAPWLFLFSIIQSSLAVNVKSEKNSEQFTFLIQFDITLNMLFMAYFFMRYEINPIDWSVININEQEDIKQD